MANGYASSSGDHFNREAAEAIFTVGFSLRSRLQNKQSGNVVQLLRVAVFVKNGAPGSGRSFQSGRLLCVCFGTLTQHVHFSYMWVYSPVMIMDHIMCIFTLCSRNQLPAGR